MNEYKRVLTAEDGPAFHESYGDYIRAGCPLMPAGNREKCNSPVVAIWRAPWTVEEGAPKEGCYMLLGMCAEHDRHFTTLGRKED